MLREAREGVKQGLGLGSASCQAQNGGTRGPRGWRCGGKKRVFLLNSPRSALPGEGTEAENTTAFLKALDGAGRLSRIRVN